MPLELGQITYIYPFDNPMIAWFGTWTIQMAVALIVVSWAAWALVHISIQKKKYIMPGMNHMSVIAATLAIMLHFIGIGILGNTYTAIAVPATSWDGITLTLTTQEIVPVITGTMLSNNLWLLLAPIPIYFVTFWWAFRAWKRTTSTINKKEIANAG